MSDDDDQRRLAEATEMLRRATLSNVALQREIAGLNARIDVMRDALVAQDILKAGHVKLMDAEHNQAVRQGRKTQVFLRVITDTARPPAFVDCEARMHLCLGRCCTMEVTLSEQDLEAGLAWEIEEPYLLRRGNDGYCTYLDRGGAGCTIYDKRPHDCRAYTCQDDPRVWIDFDKRIPAPPPESLRPIVVKQRP